MKAKLLEIINKGANRLTKDDKIFIKTCSQNLGRSKTFGACKNCYLDEAVLLCKEIEEKELVKVEQEQLKQALIQAHYAEAEVEEITEAPAEAPTERKIYIKKGVDILVNGMRVNRYTIDTDAKAEQLLKIIDRKYFYFF